MKPIHAKMGPIKDRNGRDLKEAEDIKRGGKNTQKNWMLGAGALGRPRGMVWGGRREEGSRWGTHVCLWWIHFDIWQN